MATLVTFFRLNSIPTSQLQADEFLLIARGFPQRCLKQYPVSQQSKEEANGGNKWNEWRGYTGREQ
jgi:hypothetical protein